MNRKQRYFLCWPNSTGAIDMKMGGSVFEEKSSFLMLGLFVSSKLDYDSCIITIAKIAFLENWSLDMFYEVSFLRDCFVSL